MEKRLFNETGELENTKAKELKETFETFALRALTIDDEIKPVYEKQKIQTVYGEMNLYEFELTVKARTIHYIRTGIALTIRKKTGLEGGELLRALVEFARFEVLYGLRPLIHTDFIKDQIYVKAEGFLYYGWDKLEYLKFETTKTDDKTVCVRCIAKRMGSFEIVGEDIAPLNVLQDTQLLEKSKTRAMRRALRRLFPIGTDEVPMEDIPSAPTNHKVTFEELLNGGGDDVSDSAV